MILDTNFPGGNAKITQNQEGVLIEPDLRDTGNDWFYWCFRVKSPAQERHTFKIEQRRTPQNHVAYSTDKGNTWAWVKAYSPEEKAFSFTPDANYEEIRFSMGMPYTSQNWNDFVKKISTKKQYKTETLCLSEGSMSVPILRINHNPNSKTTLYITARHHCCEMMASYAVEGIITHLLNQSSQLPADLSINIAPFMDMDGSEKGDQGKSRLPHDHNQDYIENSIYNSIKALKKEVQSNLTTKVISLDLHCPGLNGELNEKIYSVGSKVEKNREKQKMFSEILEKNNKSSLPYLAKDDLPFGEGWNKGLGKGIKCSLWFANLPNSALATSMEIPYHNAKGTDVNQESARSFGETLAASLLIYINNISEK